MAVQRIRRKKRRVTDAALRRAALFTAAFVLFAALFGAAVILIFIYGPDAEEPDKTYVDSEAPGLSENVLLIGSDGENYEKCAFLLMRMDFENRKITVTALPGELPLNYGAKERTLRDQIRYGGVLQARKALESYFDIKIARYAAVRTGTFEALVDKFGGIHFDVPHRVLFENEGAGTGFALEPGLQNLTGSLTAKMLEYDAWPGGAEYRLKVWENIAVSMINQYMNKDFLNRYGISLFKHCANSVTTDFSMTDFMVRLPGFLQMAETARPASALSLRGAFGFGETPVYVPAADAASQIRAAYR